MGGEVFPDLVLAWSCVGLVFDMTGFEFWGVQKLVLAHWLVGLDPRMAGWRVKGISELELAWWWAEPSPRVSGCRALGVPKLVSVCCLVGLDPGPTGWGAQGVSELELACWWAGLEPGSPRAGAGLLVCWLDLEKAGWRTAVVLGLVCAQWWVGSCSRRSQAWCLHPPVYKAESCGPGAGACPLVGSTESQGLWLQGLVGPGSMPACWCAALGPGPSGG